MTVVLHKRNKNGTRKPLRAVRPAREWVEYVTYEQATSATWAFDGVLS